MHEFKKKLLGTVKSDNDVKEDQKQILPDGNAYPQASQVKSLSISQKLEELRKAFQSELDQDDLKIQKKIAGTTPADLQMQSLEKGLQELRQAFRNEIVEKNTNPISSEYLHRIERRLEILKKRLDQDLPENAPQIKLEDFQSLEKRIEILRKMFEIEFAKKTGIQAFEQNINSLDHRLTELTKKINALNLDKEAVTLLSSQLESFQLELKTLENQLLISFEEQLSQKVEKSDFDQIRSVVENWTRQNPMDFNGKELLIKFSELCNKFERLDDSFNSESQRLNKLIQALEVKVETEFKKNADAHLLSQNFYELQLAFKEIEQGTVDYSKQVGFLDEGVKKIQLQVFDAQQRIEQLEAEFGQKAMSEIVGQFTEFKQNFRKKFAEQSLDFVKIDDLQKLDQKIDFLKKMFDSEFSENTTLRKYGDELDLLKDKVNVLQKSLQEELLNGENVDEIAANIEVLQTTVIELQKRFSAQINEKLDSKANAYEIANLEHQIRELTLIVEQIAVPEASSDFSEILRRFDAMEEKFRLDQQNIMEKVNYLKKTFQNEFDNNTDARLLAKSFRDLQGRFNHFETELIDKRKLSEDRFEQRLREINEKFNSFDRSLEIKVEEKLKLSSIFSQVQALEFEVNKLRSQASKDSGLGKPTGHGYNLESFDSLEILINDFKKTVLVELNQKTTKDEFKNLRAEITEQIDGLRGKVQVALEHSENSRSITHEIQQLGQLLVKVQKNEEDVKNQREEINTLSQDLNAFAIGLDDLKAKIRQGSLDVPFKSAMDEAGSNYLASLESLKKEFQNFKNESLENRNYKKDFDEVVAKISNMFDGLKKDVEVSQRKTIRLEEFSEKFEQLEKKNSRF